MQAVVEEQKGDKAPATRNRYYQRLRAILRRAMREWNWIDTVPTIRLHREPEGRVRCLTPREIDTFLRNLPERLRVLTRFAPACPSWSPPSTSTSPITTPNPSRSSGPKARPTSCRRSFAPTAA